MKNRNRRKNYIPVLILAGLTLLLPVLSGCAFGIRSSSTALSIDETGKLTEEIVENRKEGAYTEEELVSFIQGQVDAYNHDKGEDAIRLNSCMAQGSTVQISLSYASCDDYAAFNQITCFNGTLQDAVDAGYEVDRTWLEPNGVKGDMEVIRERFREWKVFIVSEPIHVKVPDKILYASDNVKVTGRLTATVKTVMNDTQAEAHPLATVADRFAYVIYK